MRITCPGCGSAYEVPDRAVPDPGRDVQCAGCGASWFLLKGGAAGPVGGVRAGEVADSAGAVPSGAVGAVHATGDAADAAEPPAQAVHDAGDRPPPRRVDPDVMRILREEAETERRARAATGGAASGRAPDRASMAGGDARAAPSPQAAAGVETAGLSDARGRLARLTEAERQAGGPARGAGAAWRAAADETDDGLVEDPDPARHGPQPPLLKALPPQATPGGSQMPVQFGTQEQGALIVLARRRRGFRLGFAATAGLCCAALGVYLLALQAGDGLDTPAVQAVLHHGGQVQAMLADWLRRVVVPALS